MFERQIAIVAAHPDDETIGVGGQLASMPDVFLIHATDGAPRSRPDWQEYARRRREELLAAAEIAGIPEERCLQIGFPDQQAALHLVELTCRLASIFDRMRAEVIVTHPYEGGHPDHDATAFAVHHAGSGMEIWEFCSYHRSPSNGGIETGCFLGLPAGRILELTPDQRRQKHRMLACFASQRDTLQWFRVDREQIRPAPRYDFTEPPHAGTMFYESYNWGVSGAEWLRLARQAETRIGCLSR